jgi:GT2 family glycosyltransferase
LNATPPTVSVVVLAYGDEPTLAESVGAVLGSTGVDVELVLVDNGCTSDGVARVKDLPGVRVLTPSENTGYAGGCVLGAAEARGDYLAFVNSDAEVRPDALAQLVRVAAEPGVGIAMGSIRLADRPELLNTAGNPIHYAGMVWVGGFEQPAAGYPRRRQVPIVSGCAFAIRRSLWEELGGGFAPEYFAYHEDTELSLRCHQRGLTVEYVPEAVVLHHYDFGGRTPTKNYLLERNRLVLVATVYQAWTLVVISPMLALTELAMLTASVLGGWSRQKVAGWGWIWRHRRWIRQRRAQLQRERTVPDRELVRIMTGRFDPDNVEAPPGAGAFNVISGAWWWVARKLIRAR